MHTDPHRSRSATAWWGVLLAAVAAALTAAVWLGPTREQGTGSADSPPGASVSADAAAVPAVVTGVGQRARLPVVEALRILREWDSSRARAWAAGDVGALRRLYTRASRAGAADRGMLAAYVARDLVVADMRTQVLSARVRSVGTRRVSLVVTDRLTAARAVGPGVGVLLPRDRPTRHSVEMVRRGGRWLVSEVR